LHFPCPILLELLDRHTEEMAEMLID